MARWHLSPQRGSGRAGKPARRMREPAGARACPSVSARETEGRATGSRVRSAPLLVVCFRVASLLARRPIVQLGGAAGRGCLVEAA